LKIAADTGIEVFGSLQSTYGQFHSIHCIMFVKHVIGFFTGGNDILFSLRLIRILAAGAAMHNYFWFHCAITSVFKRE
jgi:hypothetical protein